MEQGPRHIASAPSLPTPSLKRLYDERTYDAPQKTLRCRSPCFERFHPCWMQPLVGRQRCPWTECDGSGRRRPNAVARRSKRRCRSSCRRSGCRRSGCRRPCGQRISNSTEIAGRRSSAFAGQAGRRCACLHFFNLLRDCIKSRTRRLKSQQRKHETCLRRLIQTGNFLVREGGLRELVAAKVTARQTFYTIP